MKISKILIFTMLATISYSQVKVVDLAFSDNKCGRYAPKAADFIEHNEITSLQNILSFDFSYESVNFENINSSIIKFYRPAKFSTPGYLNFNLLKGDTCFFERHYFIEEEAKEIKWLAQLIITSVNNEIDNPIYKIEYLDGNEFIDRTDEIILAFNGGWMKDELDFKPPTIAKRKIQQENIKSEIDRKIETSYLNFALNFGFEIDTAIWRNGTINEVKEIRLFEEKFLEKLQDENNLHNSIDIAVAELSVSIESIEEFEKFIEMQLSEINLKDLSFSNINYDIEDSILEFDSELQIGLLNSTYSKHLFFRLNFKEAIYIKINSNNLKKVNEVSSSIRNSFILK